MLHELDFVRTLVATHADTALDYPAVQELVRHKDYLDELRHDARFIPELSLVAEGKNGRIRGQIVL